jgi:hypothetical protein
MILVNVNSYNIQNCLLNYRMGDDNMFDTVRLKAVGVDISDEVFRKLKKEHSCNEEI